MVNNLISVLVIEDEVLVYKLIEASLLTDSRHKRDSKYAVINAKSLSAGISAIRHALWDIIILDLGLPPESEGLDTFLAIKSMTTTPIIVITGGLFDETLFDQILDLGAYRCYTKTDLSPCVWILNYTIRHVIHESKERSVIKQQSDTLAGLLKPAIRACSGCNRWYDHTLRRWVSQLFYLKQRNMIITHGHCKDCQQDFYGAEIAAAAKDYK